MDLTRCWRCHNDFSGNSKPRWVFGPDARLLGTVHTSCLPGPGHHTIHGSESQEQAEFQSWIWWSGYETASRWMRLLYDAPEETLSIDQWESLTRWVRQEKIDVRQAVDLVNEHTEMVRAYQGWKAMAS
jgi:hypothetical protein